MIYATTIILCKSARKRNKKQRNKKNSNSFRIHDKSSFSSKDLMKVSFRFQFIFSGQSLPVGRCISLHCTTQILLLQHVSSGAERGHAGNCRSRITISTCSTPSLIQHLKLFNSAAVCCQSELNYSFNIQGSAVGINVSEHFNHCLIIQTGPQCTLRPFKPHPVSQADK